MTCGDRVGTFGERALPTYTFRCSATRSTSDVRAGPWRKASAASARGARGAIRLHGAIYTDAGRRWECAALAALQGSWLRLARAHLVSVEPCSVGVSECRAVSGRCRGGVGAVSGRCRLTPGVGVSGWCQTWCRAVSEFHPRSTSPLRACTDRHKLFCYG